MRYIVHILTYKKIVLFAQSFLCYTFIVGCENMKETTNNLKKVYKYGKEFKRNLIYQVIGCIVGIIINIVFPLIHADFIVKFTSSAFDQAIYMLIIMLIVNILDRFHTVLIRRNTQVFRRGTVRNLQKKFCHRYGRQR